MAKPEKRVSNGKTRWYARYRDPEGKQRSKTFDRQIDAQQFLNDMLSDIGKGRYLDPDAGRVLFKDYAETWLAAQSVDESTRTATAQRLRVHAYPTLGTRELRQIKPSTVQAWLRGLASLAPTTQRVIFTNVSSVLQAAVDDDRLPKNPARASSVRAPRVPLRKVIPWTVERVASVHAALPERYGILVTLGAGLGLRQGEAFALSPSDVDFLRGVVMVRRQVKIMRSRLVFALPKGGKTREVPLPATVRDELAAHLAARPAREVTLPWKTPDGEPTTTALVSTSREAKALNRNYFNTGIWRPSLGAAGVSFDGDDETGMHQLRHFYASVLLDGGESIKALSEYLGHTDPGFTLRTYTHLMPSSHERTRAAVDAALSCVRDVYAPASLTG